MPAFSSKRLYYAYEWFILRLGFHRFIAVSDYTADSLIKLGVKKKKIIRIYNGLDYEGFKKDAHSPPEDFVFTYFGRLGISKGIDLILKAAPAFLEQHPDARLKMIFPDRPKKLFRMVTHQLRSIPDERYILLHNLDKDELEQELMRSTCIMIPSYSEGFCFAAAESVALGVPLISSGQGALAEVVSGKYITMNSQDGKGLLDALEKAYAGDWKVTEMKEFPFEETVKAYLELYREFS